MGTSCQLAFPEFLETVPTFSEPTSPIQHFPYFNKQYLAVAASLNGGNVLSQFVKMIQKWIECFGKKFVAVRGLDHQWLISCSSLCRVPCLEIQRAWIQILIRTVAIFPHLFTLYSGKEFFYMMHCVLCFHFIFILSGFVRSEEEIWSTLFQICSTPSPSEGSMNVIPTIFGERHAPLQFGEVYGITSSNMDLHRVFEAVCKGLVSNLSKMISSAYLKEKGIKKLLGTGSVMHKNPIIHREVMTQYGDLDVVLSDQCDSALGAALFCEASDRLQDSKFNFSKH